MTNRLKAICAFMMFFIFGSHAQMIRTNQVGFYPQAGKMALLPEMQEGTEFFIINVDTEDTVLVGAATAAQFWSFSNGSTAQADFSRVSIPGRYIIKTRPGRVSFEFEVGNTVYDNLLTALLKAYYFQRSSTELQEVYAGDYKRALGHSDTNVKIHPAAASAERPAGSVISAPKGWYDAGDYNKYIVNSGISTYSLMAAFEHYGNVLNDMTTNIPESGNTVPDVLDEVKWNLDWMLAMQDPNDGGVYHKLTHKNFSGYVLPKDATDDRFVVPKSTAATFDFAAVMAQAYRVFKPYETSFPGFSDLCLSAALDAWEWGNDNPNVTYQQPADIKTGVYGDGNLVDEKQWAAIELYISTRDDSYYNAANVGSLNANVPSWQSVGTLGLVSLSYHLDDLTEVASKTVIQSKIKGLANQLVDSYESTPYRMVMGKSDWHFSWGSNSTAANQSLILLSAFDITNEGRYFEAAYSNIDYLLGRNPLNYSFVTGFGSNSPKNPHHRPSISDNITEPVPGLLVGGPNKGREDGCSYVSTWPALSYVDDKCSYASNEITINWNAAIFFAVAGIVNSLTDLEQRPPFILRQPVSNAVRIGERAYVSIRAEGRAPLTYQWIKNGVDIEGATNEEFAIDDLSAADLNDEYKVRISNDLGTIVSESVNPKINGAEVVSSVVLDPLYHISVYPNPSRDKKVVIETSGLINVMVFDFKGKKVKEVTMKTKELDLSSLPNGVYLLRLFGVDNVLVHSEKIILN